MNAALIRHARRLFYGQALVKQTQTTVTPRVRRRSDSPGVPISGTQKFMRSSVIHDVYVPWWQITQSKYFLTATPKTRRASNGKPYVITRVILKSIGVCRAYLRRLSEIHRASFGRSSVADVHDSDAPREAQRVILTAFGGRRVYCPLPFLQLESVPARWPRFEATY